MRTKPGQIVVSDTGLHGAPLALVFTGLLLAMFVSSISETIAATALPTIVGDLGGVEIMQWVDTTYILASTITMPLYGRLGDSWGRKGLLIFGLITYTVGKVICAVTPNMAFLIVGRLVSGIGGGGLIILTQAALADITPTRTRGKYLGVMGAVFAMCTVLGPVLGGWFVDVWGWRMIFWFTVPLAIIAIAFLALFYRLAFNRTKAHFDLLGSILMAGSVVTIVLGVAWGGNQFPWTSWPVIALFSGFVICVGLFILVERKAKEPIMPLLLFKNRNFVICSLAGMLLYIGLMGAIDYIPTFFQIVDKMNPIYGGLMVTPMSIGMFITSTASGFIAARTGKYKWMVLVMCIGAGISFWLMGTLNSSQPIILTLGIYAFAGLSMGIGLQILVLVVQNEFPHAIVGTATAANNFFRQIGSTLGASIVGSLFTSRLVANLSGKVPDGIHLSVDDITPDVVDRLPEAAQQVVAQGYTEALVPIFIWFVPLAAISFVLMLFLKQHPLKTKIQRRVPGAAPDGGADGNDAPDQAPSSTNSTAPDS